MTIFLDPVRARTGAVLVCAAFVFALVLGTSSPAQAHAIVRSTEPGIDEVVESAPERVVMTFSEAVEIALGAIRVYDTNGARVDEGSAEHVSGDPTTVAVKLADDLPNGTYTVTWRVISADSHPISEAFVFHVGAPGSRPLGIANEVLGGASGGSSIGGALFGVARWVNFASLIALGGRAGICVAGVAGARTRGARSQPGGRGCLCASLARAGAVVVGGLTRCDARYDRSAGLGRRRLLAGQCDDARRAR